MYIYVYVYLYLRNPGLFEIFVVTRLVGEKREQEEERGKERK